MANRRFIDFPIASTVGDNDIVLIWQGGANKQTTKAALLSDVANTLNGLTDVTITSLANGQILQYDSVTNQWINVDRTDIDLSELGDVSIVEPATGQVLVYNAVTGKWENSSGGYVPYIGAVTTVDLGLQGLKAGFIRFDTTITSPPTGQGTMYWDKDEETVAIILNGSTTKVGEDLFFQVKNQTGATIPKGTAVGFAGVLGASGRVLVTPFLANGSNPSLYFVGLTYESIPDGGDGKALFNGKIRGVNTSAFAVGDILYCSPTVAGGFTTTKPIAPNNIISVAAVLSSGANGILLVRPQIGSNINNDEGVKIVSPAVGDLLQYQSNGLWENMTVASLGLVPQSRTLSINGTTFDLTANRSWNIPTHDAVTLGTANGLSLSGQVLSLGLASGSSNGALSSTDWTVFSNKIGGSGTTNFLPKFAGANAIGNSQIQDNGTNVSVGYTTNPSLYKLDVNGTGRFSGDVSIINTSISPKITVTGSNSGTIGGSSIIAGTSGVTNIAIGNRSALLGGEYDATAMLYWGNGGNLVFSNGIDRLTIAPTGAATFSSNANSDWGITVQNNGTTSAHGAYINIGASSTGVPFRVDKGGSQLFEIANTGAATFSSSISTIGYTLSVDFGIGYSVSAGISGVGATSRGVNIGWNTFGDFGFIGAVHNATEWKNLVLQPIFGNVLIGTTTDNGAKLQVNGDITTSAPNSFSADKWKLGNATTSGPTMPDTWITVQVGSKVYKLLAHDITIV